MDLNNLPDLLTPSEVARIFRVVPRTIVRWCQDGTFRSDEWTRVGRGQHHRVRAAGVRRVLGEQPRALTEKIEEANRA